MISELSTTSELRIHYSGNNIVFPTKDAFFNIVSTTSTTSTRNNEYRFVVSNSFY